jgi:hypothetical protein
VRKKLVASSRDPLPGSTVACNVVILIVFMSRESGHFTALVIQYVSANSHGGL